MDWKRPLNRLGSAAVAVLCGVSAATASADTGPAQIRYSTISWSGDHAEAQDSTGKSVALGLDPHLQSETKRLLVRAKPIAGAATLIDARTGQVLAAAEIGKSQGSLLFDSVAPAASVFKIVTTAALYEKTSVTPLTTVCTEGGTSGIGREHLTPAKGPDAICAKFAYALGVSRNAAYAQLATHHLMRSDLVDVANRLGFNQPLALDAPGSLGKLDVPYNDLEFARTAAGFQNSRLSVFGGAQLALTVANGGMVRPLHFRSSPVAEQPQRAFSERTARRLRDAMEVTIHSGTARSSFVNEAGRSTVGPVQVAGKTGTLKPSAGAPTASWFIGFAPSESPRVVVSVVLQNPDKWHQRGHELGRDLLKVYLHKIGVKVSLP